MVIYDKPIANIVLNEENSKRISTKKIQEQYKGIYFVHCQYTQYRLARAVRQRNK